ncbi:hypothetical protein LTS18_009328 [Coniosporium uncinatum]|uniref:Uncharacterized protein n=1 Tax=Coniosporium uncinatum TaxID=93489 RepID=A0ACC3DX69_9PEZI|nr:hypothetical protein LTS18_009328 [Coniosporium uncinatum]
MTQSSRRRRSASRRRAERSTQKRANNACPKSTYTTPGGLDFDMHCSTNIGGNDIGNTANGATSVEDCMDQCATSQIPCYGVTFDTSSGACALKTENTSIDDGVSDPTRHSALARASELTNDNTACGYNDGSIQTSANGLNFRIDCNHDSVGNDYAPWNFPSWPLHANSFADCMDSCSKSHDYCAGVAWNPGMESGYSNCFPKIPAFVNAPRTNSNIAHLAIAQPPNLNNTCQDSGTHVASNRKQFTISCNQDRVATNIAVYHDTSLENCAETCATYNSGNCTAVVFDANMEKGYENCYLKAGNGVPNRNSDFLVAILSDELAKENNGTVEDGKRPKNSNNSSHGVSAGMIAGLVFGGVAFIAILVAILVWWRKRQAKARRTSSLPPEAGYIKDEKVTSNGYSYLPPVEMQQNAPVEISADTGPVEAPAESSPKQAFARKPSGLDDVHEMEGHVEGTIVRTLRLGR